MLELRQGGILLLTFGKSAPLYTTSPAHLLGVWLFPYMHLFQPSVVVDLTPNFQDLLLLSSVVVVDDPPKDGEDKHDNRTTSRDCGPDSSLDISLYHGRQRHV